jgi:hypothetical protein
MKDGWTVFAEKVIAALQRYDNGHKTCYAYYLMADEKEGVEALAEVMGKVNRASQWEPIVKGGPPHNG